jgi:hypothetical protein
MSHAPKNIALSDAEWSNLTPQGQTFIQEAQAGGLRYLVDEDHRPYAWGWAVEGIFRKTDVVCEPHDIDGLIINLRHPHPRYPSLNGGERYMIFTGPNDGTNEDGRIYVWKLFGPFTGQVPEHPRTQFLVFVNNGWHLTDREAIANRNACLGIEDITDFQLEEILALHPAQPSRLP